MNKSFVSLRLLLLGLFAVFAVTTRAQDAASTTGPLPDKPTQFFSDFALATRADTRATLNHRLAEFERQTSNQVLVAIFPKLPEGAEVADYAQRVFRAWAPGQAGRDNGAVLFVFVQNRKVRIQTGRGLEGALPDATCRRIIADQIAPRFKANDYDGGLIAGVDAMLAASKGEFQGTGRTVAEGGRAGGGDVGAGWKALVMVLGFLFLHGGFVIVLLGVFAVTTFLRAMRQPRRGQVYGGDGYQGMDRGGVFFPMGGFGGSGGGGGGFGGGGGGGSNDSFSGGGGDSGGGGAGGDW